MALNSEHFPSLGTDESCTCCGRSLNHKKIAWLELDQRDDTYHARQDVPPEKSQGWFPFGQACARKVEKASA
jgi:hypothetical protein